MRQKLLVKLIVLGVAISGFAVAAESVRVGPSTTISFKPGKASLTDDSKSQLNQLVKDAKSSGRIDELQIAAWSDNFIPVGKKQLSKADRLLADQRVDALRSYLKGPLGVDDVVTYNMAERSTWLGRMFETDDAELKSEITRGVHAEMSRDEFRVFKENGKPSSAVVLTLIKL